MRSHLALVTPFVIASMSACVSAQEESRNVTPMQQPAAAEPADPMVNFARMTGGEWKVTAASGTSMYHAWQWGPGQHSIRRMTDGADAAGKPWRELQVYYWHPGRKQVSVLGLSPFENGVSEGTIKFNGKTAEAVVSLYQTGRHRAMGLQWSFDGADEYHEVLLESTDGEGLKPLTEWDYVRLKTPRERSPRGETGTPALSKPLKAFEKILGSAWNAKGQWVGGDAFHIETTFEWVPLANAIYARTFVLRGNGTPIHVLDTYFYHHTGTDRVRCLAFSKWGDWPEAIRGMYEGEVTIEDGGAFKIDLKGHEDERVVSFDVRFELEKDGTLHHRVWSIDGGKRTPMLDVRHMASELSRAIMVVFQDKKNNHWFGSQRSGLYRYDGTTVTHYTMDDGLFGNQIGGIQEDKAGNLYITATQELFIPPDTRPSYPTRINRFDGRVFSTLPEPEGSSFGDWTLGPDDVWFGGGSGEVHRWDGEKMHRLKMPTSKIGQEFIAKRPRSKYPFMRHTPYDIFTIFRDSRGSVWFGTGNVGALRFDGKSHAWISEDEFTWLDDGAMMGLRSIIEDKNGKFWFTSTLNCYDVYPGGKAGQTDDLMHYKKEKGIDNKTDDDDYFISAVNDDNGDLWMATYGAGVWRYDGTKTTSYPVMDGNEPTSVFSIYKDRQGGIWLGTHLAGAYKFNGKAFEKFRPRITTAKMSASADPPETEGPAWSAEPVKRDPYFTPTPAKSTPYMPRVIIRNIQQDRVGNVWFATYAGPIRYDGNSFTNYAEETGLANTRVFSLLETRSGDLWFGSITGGASRYDGRSYTKFTDKEGLGNNDITWIFEDRDANIWFATGNGATRYDGQSMTNFTTKDGIVHNSVYTIGQDASGRIWFGTQGGICSYDGKSFSNLADKVGRSFINIRSMAVDRSGHLWFGGQEGAFRYDGKTIQAFTSKEGLLTDFVGSMIVDRAGNIWFGHPDGQAGGATRYDGKSFTHFTQADGLGSTNVYCMHEDKNGNIWFGSVDAGACRYDGKTFTLFSETTGHTIEK